MKEVLDKLFEAEVLSSETKKELEQAFESKINEAIEEVKESTSIEVKAELAEQWIIERDALIEAIDSKVSEFLNDEISELREDINRFRDLELEYAEKLVEQKAQMSNELEGDLLQLVEKLDSFIEIRLNSELTELREDIQVQKENQFGRKIFEAVSKEFENNYAKDDDLSNTLIETKLRLSNTEQALIETTTELEKLERNKKLMEVLSPLNGRKREVMEAILKNVSTNQLEEGYKTFIGRVLKETEEQNENDTNLINENKTYKTRKLKENIAITGDNNTKITENNKTKLSESAKSKLQKLAGI